MEISKNTFLYGVIVLLILVICWKSLFASDEETMKDSLSIIDGEISALNSYKQKITTELNDNTKKANTAIENACAKIPESLKKEIDCKKFIQTNEIKTWTSTGGIAPVPERQGTEGVSDPTLREALNLKDCRFTNAKHKYPRDNISFQAVDIACNKWESFGVYTPNWKNEYVVTKIGHWTNMGNYIVLKSWDYHFVFGHTVASPDLKIGSKLKNNVYIWSTNVSGESTGVHLHFELWEWNSNINGRFMVWDKIIHSPDSQRLLDKRKWNFSETQTEKKYWEAYEKAITILHREEWLHEMWSDWLIRAYPDAPVYNSDGKLLYYRACSIGYGSRAKSCDETITVQEANSRLAYIVRDLVDKVQYVYPKLGTDAQASIVSFAFNCHKWYADVVKNWLQQHQIWCKKAGWVRLQALVDRRNDEWNSIVNDPSYKFYTK